VAVMKISPQNLGAWWASFNPANISIGLTDLALPGNREPIGSGRICGKDGAAV
jgi:hypothetical protein